MGSAKRDLPEGVLVMIAHRYDLIRACEALGFPTNDALAASLWRMGSSYYGIPFDVAKQLYRDCGYIPYCGFPLARAGKIGRMTRREVEHELENNPLCHLAGEVALTIV